MNTTGSTPIERQQVTDPSAGSDKSVNAATTAISTSEDAAVPNSRLGRFANLADAFYFTVLGIWMGAYVVMGIAAGKIFTVSRELAPVVTQEPFNQEAFAGLEHSDILAGYQFGAIFSLLSGLMTILALCTVAGYGFRFSQGRWQGLFRWYAGAALVVAVLFFGFSRVQGKLVYEYRNGYYYALEQGDVDQAKQAKQAFDQAHANSSSTGKGALTALAVVWLFSVLPSPKRLPKNRSSVVTPKTCQDEGCGCGS